MNPLRAMPVLQVADMAASIAFYQRLGFRGKSWRDDDGQNVFTIVQRGDVTVALQRTDPPVPVNSHWAVYIYVDDVGALHNSFAADGISATAIRRHNVYSCHDFDVRDPDGHMLCFGQDMDPEPGPGLAHQEDIT